MSILEMAIMFCQQYVKRQWNVTFQTLNLWMKYDFKFAVLLLFYFQILKQILGNIDEK